MSDEIDAHTGEVHRRDAARIVRLLVVAAVVVAVVAIAFDNRDDVRLGYVFGDVQAPIWIVIVGALLVGVALGWLIRHRPRRRA